MQMLAMANEYTIGNVSSVISLMNKKAIVIAQNPQITILNRSKKVSLRNLFSSLFTAQTLKAMSLQATRISSYSHLVNDFCRQYSLRPLHVRWLYPYLGGFGSTTILYGLLSGIFNSFFIPPKKNWRATLKYGYLQFSLRL